MEALIVLNYWICRPCFASHSYSRGTLISSHRMANISYLSPIIGTVILSGGITGSLSKSKACFHPRFQFGH